MSAGQMQADGVTYVGGTAADRITTGGPDPVGQDRRVHRAPVGASPGRLVPALASALVALQAGVILLQSLKPTTRLCLARDLTGSRELIQTATVEQWRERQAPALDKTPCIFLFLAGR